MKNYDVIAILFAKVSLDARLLNVLKIICKEKKVCVISIDEKSFVSQAEEIRCDYVPIYVCRNNRMVFQWIDFTKKVKSFSKKYSAKTILASDLYALPSATFFKGVANRLLYDSREIYSALGSLYKSPIKQFIISRIEKRYIKKVDEIIVSGEIDADYLKSYFKHDLPYHVLMNLPQFKEPIKSNFLRDKYKIPEDKKIVLYQGALINGRGIELIIEAVKLIDNAVLCIIGDGPWKDKLTEMISQENLYGKVYMCGVYSYDDLHEITCSGDIGTAFFEPVSFSYELALPNKLFEYMLAGKAVIASDLPAIRRVYEEFEFGKLLNHRANANEAAEAIKQLIDSLGDYTDTLARATQKYHYEKQTNLVKTIFR